MKNFYYLLLIFIIGITLFTSCKDSEPINFPETELIFSQRTHTAIGSAKLQVTDEFDCGCLSITCPSNNDGVSIPITGSNYAEIEFGANNYNHGNVFNYKTYVGESSLPKAEIEMTFLDDSNLELAYISSSPIDDTISINGYLDDDLVLEEDVVITPLWGKVAIGIAVWIADKVSVSCQKEMIVEDIENEDGTFSTNISEKTSYKIGFGKVDSEDKTFDIDFLGLPIKTVTKLEIVKIKKIDEVQENEEMRIDLVSKNLNEFLVFDEIIY